MAHTPSAKKRLRQSKKKRIVNKSEKSLIKSYEKRVEKSLEDGSVSSAQEDLQMIQARLDKAAQRRILHPNTANRIKSRLARKVSAFKKKDAAKP